MIETQDYKAVYDCDGSLTSFDFSFPITDEGDLDIKHYDDSTETESTLSLNIDYVVTQATYGTWLDGGTITTTVVYPSPDRISISRDVPLTQLLDYIENDPFPAESHERGLDKVTIISQQLEEAISRAILIPKSDPTNLNLLLGALEERLGKFIQFDLSTGEPKLVTAVDPGTVTITPWAETLLDDADADEAKGTLEITEPDLIIESASDFGELAYGGATQYPSVLIKSGTYSISIRLDLHAHGVKYLRGETENTTVEFTVTGAGDPLMRLDDDGVMENLTVETTGDITGSSIIKGRQIAPDNISLKDIHVEQTANSNTGIGFDDIDRGVINCKSVDCLIGFNSCKNLVNCKDDGSDDGFVGCTEAVSCTAENEVDDGFNGGGFFTNCQADGCGGDGFNTVPHVTNCAAQSCTGQGFNNCDWVTGCSSLSNTANGFLNCTEMHNNRGASNGVLNWSNSPEIKQKIVDIGNWNMNVTVAGVATVAVAHGLSSEQDIRGVQVTIRDDTASLTKPLDLHDGAGGLLGGITGYTSTNINLAIVAGGTFDTANYDSPVYNRGWIYIEYQAT